MFVEPFLIVDEHQRYMGFRELCCIQVLVELVCNKELILGRNKNSNIFNALQQSILMLIRT